MITSVTAMALDELPIVGPAILCMGVFDGVHLGHRALLEATRAVASARGIRSVALVFDPAPDEVLRPGTIVPRLAPTDVNLSRIEALGTDLALPVRFDEALRELTEQQFLESLSPTIAVRGLTMSRRSAFGRDRAGTVQRMQELGTERGFSVSVVEPVEVEGAIVSSTRIRAAIADGDVDAARRMGVTPYLSGTVVSGDRRGRELGFPTANLRFDYAPAMPRSGIYAGRVTLGDRVPPGQPSLISIGTRPTFHDHGELLAEVHLLDFEGDLYGMQLGVDLLARLRDEQRFSDADALIVQMRRDAEMGRNVLGLA